MSITVYKRPNDRCWSGNPIHYQLYSGTAAADATIVFEIKIKFKRADAAAYSDIVVLPYNPVNGYADVDIQDILDSLMDYEVPYIIDPPEYASPLFCRQITGLFYIQFREITTIDPDPAWVDTESANELFVIKGGIAFHKWRGNNYWENYFDPLKPFLTWQQSARLASLGERMYVAWLNLTDADPADLRMRRKLVFTDASEYTYDHNFPSNKYDVVYFPAGATQLLLDEVFPTKEIWYWTLQVWNLDTGLPESEEYKYELDNRNDYNGITLNYRNSLGGLDSVRVRGTIEYNLQREFAQQGHIVQHDYFTGGFISGKIKAANSTELLQYKGDIGHLNKEEQDRLRDIHLQREVWWEISKKWLPILAMTGSTKKGTTEDQLWGMPIEFAISSGGDRYYTPDNVDLQDGDLPSIVVCDVVIGVPTYVFDDPEYTVNWTLVSGAPNKYFISTPGVSGGAPQESLTNSYQYLWLPEGDNVIKVQPLCLIAGVYHYGVPQYVTITIAAACTPVAISGSPLLPDATEEVAYTYSFSVTGTAPFALANVVKPDWMTIIVDGSDIEFSGTPGVGDEANDTEVSFDITNCDGNSFVHFTQAIDVVGVAHNFKVMNMISGWLIEDVAPAIFTYSSGAYPLLPGSNAEGDHAGFTSDIDVALTRLTGPAANLRLYKNGVLQQTIAVSASTSYEFTGATYVIGDVVHIKLDL